MVTYRFIFNSNQMEVLNSIVVGIVEINLEKEVKYVPGYLISKSFGFLIIFKAGDKIRTVCIQSVCLKETSRLITYNNKNIGIIGFNLGDGIGLDFYNHTGLLFPNCQSKIYDDSRFILAVSKNLPSGTTQFNLTDLLVNISETVKERDFNFYETRIKELLKLDIKVLAAYVLNMLHYALTISNNWQAKFSKGNIPVNEAISKAEKTYQYFADYLSGLDNIETNVQTIKVVEQEAQKLLPACSKEDKTIKTTVVEIPDEAYIYYNAELGYFENEVIDLVDTDDLKETVISNINPNNNTEVNSMSAFKFNRSADVSNDVSIEETVVETPIVEETIAPVIEEVQTPVVNHTVNPVVETKTMQNSAVNRARAAQTSVAAPVASVVVETPAVAAPKVKAQKVLASVEIVVNITMTSRLIPDSVFGTIQDKNKGAIINTRSCGLILRNREENSAYATFRPIPAVKQDSYGNNNMALVIFHYEDGTKEILDVNHTVKFWDNVLEVSNISSADINFLVKTQFRVDAETLEEGIRDGSVRAYSIKFDDLNANMFANPQESAFTNSLTLPVAKEIWATPLRSTVEVAQKGQKFSMSSKFFSGETVVSAPVDYKMFAHRADGKVSTSAKNQAAAEAFLHGSAIPKTSAAVAPKVTAPAPAVSVAVVAPVETIIVDAEKVALRKENAELKLEISSLKLSIEAMNANMVALTAAVEAMSAVKVASQTVEENAAPVLVVEETIVEVIEAVEEVIEVVPSSQEELNAALVAAQALVDELIYSGDESAQIAASYALCNAKRAARTPEQVAIDAAAAKASQDDLIAQGYDPKMAALFDF